MKPETEHQTIARPNSTKHTGTPPSKERDQNFKIAEQTKRHPPNVDTLGLQYRSRPLAYKEPGLETRTRRTP
ncbi:Hypothetical predicted protein [Pelobates cultripes]|uniref:Uncharacterized protein n=1 Tax=Pelobates cultripes TaxID=61616 RepID=A0AAD1WNG2_PELCU|nr:Hypothetical predicted protein [Pelobates cultripes]